MCVGMCVLWCDSIRCACASPPGMVNSVSVCMKCMYYISMCLSIYVCMFTRCASVQRIASSYGQCVLANMLSCVNICVMWWWCGDYSGVVRCLVHLRGECGVHIFCIGRLGGVGVVVCEWDLYKYSAKLSFFGVCFCVCYSCLCMVTLIISDVNILM